MLPASFEIRDLRRNKRVVYNQNGCPSLGFWETEKINLHVLLNGKGIEQKTFRPTKNLFKQKAPHRRLVIKTLKKKEYEHFMIRGYSVSLREGTKQTWLRKNFIPPGADLLEAVKPGACFADPCSGNTICVLLTFDQLSEPGYDLIFVEK